MALATKVNSAAIKPLLELHRFSDTSGADAALTVTTPAGRIRRLLYVTVVYSTSVTKNVTVTLNSGAGSDYDIVLDTIALSSDTSGKFIPSGDIFISDDDVIDVAAPAGGAAETSSVAIYTESM